MGEGALMTEGEARGEETLGGEGSFGGVSILRGEITEGGEYVRGEASVGGERKPVGEAKDGNGIAERAVMFTKGVPTPCSGSVLKSRRTADGNKAVPGLYGLPCCHCFRSPRPTGC